MRYTPPTDTSRLRLTPRSVGLVLALIITAILFLFADQLRYRTIAADLTATPISGARPVAITLSNAKQVVELARLGRGTVEAIAWSPDGHLLAVGSTLGVWLYDPANVNAAPRLLEGNLLPIRCVAFSADGRYVAGGSGSPQIGGDDNIYLWDAVSGQLLAVMAGHTAEVRAIAFTPDGTRLFSTGADGSLRTWAIPSGKPLAQITSHPSVETLALSPDGQTVATAGYDTIKLWNATTLGALFEIKGDPLTKSLAFSPDSKRLASAGFGKIIQLWDTATGRNLASLIGHTNWIYSVGFNRDGTRLISASADRSVRTWDSQSGLRIDVFKTDAYVYAAAYSPNQTQIAAITFDNSVRLLDAATGRERGVLPDHTLPIAHMAVSNDGSQIATTSLPSTTLNFSDHNLRLWDPSIGQQVRLLNDPSQGGPLAYSPDKSQLALAVGGDIYLMSLITQHEATLLRGGSADILALAFSADGTRLSSIAKDGTLLIWDPASNRQLATLGSRLGNKESAVFSPDSSRLITYGDHDVASIWDGATGRSQMLVYHHLKQVQAAAFNLDGTRLVLIGDGDHAELWDLSSTHQVLDAIELPDSPHIALSSDGSLLAVPDSHDIQLWDLATDRAVAVLKGHRNNDVTQIAFSLDGTRLFSASNDGTVRVWGIR